MAGPPHLVRALIVAALFWQAGEAGACVWLPILYFGHKPAPEERRADEKRLSVENVRSGTRQAAQEWTKGVDAARELAEMLVPNIRPVYIEVSDCGPTNEIDPATGRWTPEDWLAGTPYGGRGDEFFALLSSPERTPPGERCNAEFRDRFAAWLRRRLTREELRDSYLFLRARFPGGSVFSRLMRFEGWDRRPPVVWYPGDQWQRDQIRRWSRLQPRGRALKSAMDAFWKETGPLLADSKLACPAATAKADADRIKVVKLIEATLERRRAARERKPAS